MTAATTPDVETTNDTGIVSEVWRAIVEFASTCSANLRAINVALTTFLNTGMNWILEKIFFPVVTSGINVFSYIFDKIAFGSPGLRPYLHDGLFKSEIPDGWRDWIRNNSGWDIYETMGTVPSNILGILGGGIGVLNFLNHALTSFCRNSHRFSHLLGENGVFGSRSHVDDKRNSFIKVVFGTLSFPFVAPVILFTNMMDGLFTIIENFFLSYTRNVRCVFNLCGEHGVFGKRRALDDNRTWPAIIIFGILSAPLTLVTALITNMLDLALVALGNFWISYGVNVRSTFNLLGTNGVFGEHRKYSDARKWPAIIAFGLLSAPLVLLTSAVTNMLDLSFTCIKNLAQSFSRNLSCTYNLLGEHGVFGARNKYADARGWPAVIFYGALTAPFVTIVAAFTNLIDLACVFSRDFYLSFTRNLRPFAHLLGKDGVFGERPPYEDKRHIAVRIVYGILSAPFVFVTALFTNTIDFIGSFAKNFGRSYLHNVTPTFNLLGTYGVFGVRSKYADERGWPAILLYGAISLPLVIVSDLITNTLDLTFTLIKHTFLSLKHNLAPIANLLGKNGVFGERSTYDDKRGWPAVIFYGALSSPLVAAGCLLTNTLDLFCTFTKNFMQSYIRNVSATFNFLGEYGIFGKRHGYNDDRSMLAKVAYGALSAPLVWLTSLVTNAIDLIGAYLKNWRHTIKKPATFATGLVAGTLLAIPVFVIRKTLKGVYNFTIRPFLDLNHKEPFQPLRMVKGLLNFASLGLFSAGKKVFEAVSGYSSRFGFLKAPMDNYDETQKAFKDAISLAIKGKLPGIVDHIGRFRPMMRVFYHMRHKAEDILKSLHDAYQTYARGEQKNGATKQSTMFSMSSFFHSKEYIAAHKEIKDNLRAGEEQILENVDQYLLVGLRA